MDEHIVRNDVVQITDENDPWYPCLLIVDEVKSWGIQGYVLIPHGQGEIGTAYYRIGNGKFEFIGASKIAAE